jgi:hypothetical protein
MNSNSMKESRVYKSLPYPGWSIEASLVARVLLALIDAVRRDELVTELRPLVECLAAETHLDVRFVEGALRSTWAYQELWLDDECFDEQMEIDLCDADKALLIVALRALPRPEPEPANTAEPAAAAA